MSLFSSISDSFGVAESPATSIGDDNVGLSSEQNNSFVSTAILGMRASYDGIHSGFSYVIKGKKSSLKQITKYIDAWIKTLDGIVEKYKEMLEKLNDVGADISGAFTLDFAKEAWEIIQDTPILRRYLGEANYWYLYDTLGLLATQTGRLSADALSGIKMAIKQAILAVIAATDGLINLQSYLGYLQSAWGFLYVKCFDHFTLDSVLPQVTTAYWYKPTHASISAGTAHPVALTNDPPGKGFVPVPLPVPIPSMVVRNASYVTKFDAQNPDTWYLGGVPYYMPNTMDMLYKALQYWGSSYTDALHIPNVLYDRRKYTPHGEDSDQGKPLRVGKTLFQLDTSKMSICGTNKASADSNSEPVDIEKVLKSVFTDNMLEAMKVWREAYHNAYKILVNFMFSRYPNGYTPPKYVTSFWATNNSQYLAWKSGGSDDANLFRQYINIMLTARLTMRTILAEDRGVQVNDVSMRELYDSVMAVLVEAGHASEGYDYSLEDSEMFMAGPSFCPSTMVGVGQEQAWALGIPYVVYKVDTSKSYIKQISSGNEVTMPGDAVNVSYPISDIAFVMFPSDVPTTDVFMQRSLDFSFTSKSLLSTLVRVPNGMPVNSHIDTGVVTEFMLPFGMEGMSQAELGEAPGALYKHRSSGLDERVNIVDAAGNVTGAYLGNIFFPDGKMPESLEDAEPPKTFLDVYESYIETTYVEAGELADVVGYAINHGREPKFPCFGIYGNLLRMASWDFKEMEYDKFVKQYTQVKSKSKLYYRKADPSHLVMYLSSYFSQSRQMQIAVYHESVAQESKSYGSGDAYTYYVFPGESISVSKLPQKGVLGYNLGNLMSVDATSPDGDDYHYTVIKNPTPLCPKYVDPEEWSFMDIVYEMTLLAHNLAGLCGDNGKRLKQLEDDLKEFGLSIPRFLGELPENNGQYVDFKFTILEEYSKKIEDAVNSVYDFRAKLIAATEAW